MRKQSDKANSKMTTSDSADGRWVYERNYPYYGRVWSILSEPSTFAETRDSLFARLAQEVWQCAIVDDNNADRIYRLRNEVTGESILILGPASGQAFDFDTHGIVDSGVEAVFTSAATKITGEAIERNKGMSDAAMGKGGTTAEQS